jgi:hypothetical protein
MGLHVDSAYRGLDALSALEPGCVAGQNGERSSGLLYLTRKLNRARAIFDPLNSKSWLQRFDYVPDRQSVGWAPGSGFFATYPEEQENRVRAQYSRQIIRIHPSGSRWQCLKTANVHGQSVL